MKLNKSIMRNGDQMTPIKYNLNKKNDIQWRIPPIFKDI